MAKHLHTGKQGEQLAANALIAKGYRILERNWRSKHLEIDLIAMDEDILVFIEVKTRNDLRYGDPYEAIDWKKEKKLARAANAYMKQINHRSDIRFDIVSIVYPQDVPGNFKIAPQVEVIQDAFWPK